MKRLTLVPVAAAVLSLSMLVAGCGADDDEPGKKNDEEPTAQAGGEWSVSSALAEIPASVAGKKVWLQTADLAAAVEAAGLERAEGGDTVDWMLATSGVGRDGKAAQVFVPYPELIGGGGSGPERFQEVTGIDLNDVDSVVEQATAPEDLVVLNGDGLGPDQLNDQLVEQDGVLTDLEGEDLAVDFDKSDTALSRLGRPTRIRAEDGAVALSSTTPAVKDWRGDGETLADNESLAAVASALDEADVYSAVVTDVSGGGLESSLTAQNLTPEQAKAVAEEMGKYIPEEPFDAVGIGWSVEDDVARVHVAYHFEDDAAATAGLATLEQAWSEGTLVQSRSPITDYVTVEDSATDGDVATLTLGMVDQGPSAIVLNMLVQQEPLFVSE